MQAGIREVLIISNPQQINLFENLLGDGNHLGISIQYAVQSNPNGLPEAFIIGEQFIDGDPVALNLGDHIFFGDNLSNLLSEISNNFDRTILFSVQTENPQESGVIKFKKDGTVDSIVEKPRDFISDWIVCGLYFYTSDVCDRSKKLNLSPRNELEITDLNNQYFEKNEIQLKQLDNSITWLDAGTPDRILQASNAIKELEDKGKYYGYLEFIALQKGYINNDDFNSLVENQLASDYGQKLNKFALKL